MKWLTLPPLTALRAFGALAETRSITAVGQALNVSHAAVSQQIRALEKHLDLQLITRVGRGVALTEPGRRLAEAVTGGFAMIEQRIAELTDADADRPVQLSITPAFAASWLMPRISDFRHHHPEIDLMLNPTASIVELAPGGVDVAVRFGRGDWPGLEASLLIECNFAIVAARSLIGTARIEDPAELLDYPWLQELGTTEVDDWLRQHGVTSGRTKSTTHLPGNLLLEGLRRGDGISATARAFLEDDIAAGRLVVLFEDQVPGAGYYIVTRPGIQRPAVRAVTKWLRRQAAGQT